MAIAVAFAGRAVATPVMPAREAVTAEAFRPDGNELDRLYAPRATTTMLIRVIADLSGTDANS